MATLLGALTCPPGAADDDDHHDDALTAAAAAVADPEAAADYDDEGLHGLMIGLPDAVADARAADAAAVLRLAAAVADPAVDVAAAGPAIAAAAAAVAYPAAQGHRQQLTGHAGVALQHGTGASVAAPSQSPMPPYPPPLPSPAHTPAAAGGKAAGRPRQRAPSRAWECTATACLRLLMVASQALCGDGLLSSTGHHLLTEVGELEGGAGCH